MSSTNPDPGRPADPVSGLTHTAPGSPHADNHDVSGPPAPATIARGHEVDSYDATSVFSVPLLVVLLFALAFVTVTVIFYFIAPSTVDPGAHPQAAEQNSADLNTRMGRIHRGGEVDQPRLEPLRTRSGDLRAITRPELPTGNPPELHPEDLRPSPTNTPALYRGGAGKLTIDEAMEAALKKDKNYLPHAAAQSKAQDSAHRPTASNAGRGFGPSKAEPPKPPAAPEAKKAEGK
jgi:hypothetical protein